MSIVEASVTARIYNVSMTPNGLTLPLPDGSTTYFNNHWLRDNCPCSFDATTRERSFDIFHLPEPPKPAMAWVDDDSLVIDWAGEDHRSTYPLSLLAQYKDGTPRPDPAAKSRRAWYSDHYKDMARFSQPNLMQNDTEVAQWIEALLIDGVAIVGDMPDNDAGLTELAERIGQIRPTFFGAYFDVKTHINPTNSAYTAAALELHTDTPAEEHAPGIQFLHCRANSVEGGRNLFGDGVAVANDFRTRDPEGFKLLSEVAVPFYCEHDSYDMRSRQRVIELDADGAVEGVTISQHMLDLIDLPQALLDDYYPAFCRFGRMLQEERYLMRFTLNAGECIVFDNHRIVHGRAAYTASSGDRYLRGCYTDRAEMRSTYRALVSEGRFKA